MLRAVNDGSKDMFRVGRKPRHAPKRNCFYVADYPLQINRRADANVYASGRH